MQHELNVDPTAEALADLVASQLALRSPTLSPGAASLSPSHGCANAVGGVSPSIAALDPAFGPALLLQDDNEDDADDKGAASHAHEDRPFDPRRAATSTPPPFAFFAPATSGSLGATSAATTGSSSVTWSAESSAAPTASHPRRTGAAKRTPEDRFVVGEATVDDAEAIVALTARVNMEGATSFVWPVEDLRRRIAERAPLVVVAYDGDAQNNLDDAEGATGRCVGVAGIDIRGMEKDFPVMSIGSRFSRTPAGETFVIPDDWCMCRGLLIDEAYQGCGLGSLLHKTRLSLLSALAPDTPSVVLSARGSSFQEARVTLGPIISVPHDVTPEFDKDTLFEFTFPTSRGVVHLAHGRESDGWKFIGVDESDGGPVWCSTLEMAALTRSYSHLGSAASSFRLSSFRRGSASASSLCDGSTAPATRRPSAVALSSQCVTTG